MLNGDAIYKDIYRSKILLNEMGLPSGLLPFDNIEELDYVKDTGFMWLKQKKDKVHEFE